MKAEPDLLRRHRALGKTLAKYRGVPFAWGHSDCIAALRSHLVATGHKRLPKPPRYRSALGARRALAALGFADVAAMLDSMLPRIAPAQALPGDVLLMGGLEGLDAVVFWVGGNKVAGWHEDGTGMVVIVPDEIKGAWRA